MLWESEDGTIICHQERSVNIMKIRKLSAILIGVICFGMLAGSTSLASENTEEAQKLLNVMTKEDKVGQMLMVSPSQLCGGDWTQDTQQVLQNIDLYHIGNLIFFEEDLKNQEAVKALTDALAGKTGLIGVLTAADGTGSLANGFTKPTADTVLATGPFEEGTDGLWGYGITVASVADLQALGITIDITPGISPDAASDSAQSASFAVVTHAKVNSDNDMDGGRPASMAKSIVKDNLRSIFDGVILTDSLSMTAATEVYGADMAVQYAFQAGNDILTAPSNPGNAYYGMLSAMDEQLVSEEQVNESVLRILEAKEALGLLK